MYTYLQITEEGHIVGFYEFNEKMPATESLINVKKKDLPFERSNFAGWSYIDDVFLPPTPSTPPSKQEIEIQNLCAELAVIDRELHQLFHQSQFESWLGREIPPQPTALELNIQKPKTKEELLSKRDEIISQLNKIKSL